MNTHPEKKPRPLQHRTPAKSPIATPPRAALGRSKSNHGDNASIKSFATGDSIHTQNGSPEDTEESGPSSAASIGEKQEKDREKENEKGGGKKIMVLEQELETMASEFEKELTLLSHKLSNERESSNFWQQKHTALHQTYIQTDTSLRLLRSELSALQGSQTANQERDREVKTKISSLMLDRDAFREAYNEAMGEVSQKEEVIDMLRGQVRGLKSWVSKGGRGGEEQASDESIGEGWGRLSNGLQNWVIVNFRRVKVGTFYWSFDLEFSSPFNFSPRLGCRKTVEIFSLGFSTKVRYKQLMEVVDTKKPDSTSEEELLRLLPNYETLASTSKIHFIQSLVSRILVDSIFTSYFVGIPPEKEEELAKVEAFLRDFGSQNSLNFYTAFQLTSLNRPRRIYKPMALNNPFLPPQRSQHQAACLNNASH